MADIISLNDRRRKPERPTVPALASDCAEEISASWERFARNNRLNEYFAQCTPSWSQSGVNYLSDLNALSLIEGRIGLGLTLLAPGTVDVSQLGWIAGFRVAGVPVTTPFMVTEAYARCFNILLFLKIARELATGV